MKIQNRYLMLSLLSIVLSGCLQDEKHSPKRSSEFNYCSSFHKDDLVRIPLIYPYDIISANEGYSLVFQGFKSSGLPPSISEIDSVGVNYPYICFYSSNMSVPEKHGMASAYFTFNVLTDSIIAEPDFFSLNKDSIIVDFFYLEDVVNMFKESSEIPWECGNVW